MAQFHIENVEIKGIAGSVPPRIEHTSDIPLYSKEKAKSVAESTGVYQKHIADIGITASDLCIDAAKNLLNNLNWEMETIDVLVFVTQTPDYDNHPDAFIAHEKLGLKQDCLVLDLFHGCPGWVMGLATISSLMNQCKFKRGLLLAGDCLTQTHYKLSPETRPLFGDAGSATAIEFNDKSSGFTFDTGTLSKDGMSLVNAGGLGRARHPFTPETFLIDYELKQGLRKASEEESQMDGMSVFAFGLSKPPKSVKKLLENIGKDKEEIDYFVFHQANKLMVEKIASKLKLSSDKWPLSLPNYGNTVSASIPMTIVAECREKYQTEHLKTIGCAFGTGLSWGSVYFETDKIICPPISIYKNE